MSIQVPHFAESFFDLPAPLHRSGLPVPNSTHSFWINSPGANPLAKEGSEDDLDTEVDVCIIGLGITGVSAAYHLSKAQEGREFPLKVTILEASYFCSGATGRNGGHLTAETFDGFAFCQSKYGPEEAKKAHKTKEEEVEWLTEEEVLKEYGSKYPACRYPGNNVWPLKLVTHLYKLSKKFNPSLKLHTNTPVTSISPSESASATLASRRWRLHTPRGDIHATYIIDQSLFISTFMPKSKQPTRDDQPYTGSHGSGFGQHFTSPVKRRPGKKALTLVAPLGNSSKRRRLEQELEQLQLQASVSTSHSPFSGLDSQPDPFPDAGTLSQLSTDAGTHSQPVTDAGTSSQSGNVETNEISNTGVTDGVVDEEFRMFPVAEPASKTRRILPDRSSQSLYSRWQNLLPKLVNPFLQYSASVNGQVPPCRELTDVLISNGLFPTAPSHPRMAVSVHLLDFYHTLFERSCDAVNAMAAALNTFYKKRGFVMINRKGAAIQDPFRKGLGYAIQWYDNLQISIEKIVEDAIASAGAQITSDSSNSSIPFQSKREVPATAAIECDRLLQKRCPACFGGNKFGRPFADGGDMHVCIDGNFNHRHLKSSGDCPPFYEPEYMLPKHFVDEVGLHIESVRKRKPKARKPVVPDEAINQCESMHIAGSGSNAKTNMEKFDDGGVMALVCRHDIPLFLANIDTPGEQQKYAVALIKHLFTFLPPNAVVSVLYDVGCVLDRSCQLYEILPRDISPRVGFATSAMHAYVHEWACQLVFNPRFRIGLGLTDGEGVERLWSCLRQLIGITRVSHRRRRVWMLDRQVRLIGLEHRDGLGTWIKRRLKKGVEGQGATAQRTIKECGIPIDVLREQWADQRQAQLSVRAHAPMRLKKELDAVLTLQGQMDAFDTAIDAIKKDLRSSSAPAASLKLLSSLQKSQEDLKEKGEALYASLNVHEAFPELKDVDLEFVRTLLMARDLKINIRKRAIGSFLEWDKLDQAAGGREKSLGTKLHQVTRAAISKRAPALQSAIRKFNGYCETLATLNKPEYSIPLPQPLPVTLSELRESPTLMEDVWISRTTEKRPRWLEEPEVREGIRAILKADRCLEERRRLGVEADNLCRWYGRELRAINMALSSPSSMDCISSLELCPHGSLYLIDDSISILLQRERDHLILLKSAWANPLASVSRFEAHIAAAASVTSNLKPATDLTWIPSAPKTSTSTIEVDEDDSDEELTIGTPHDPVAEEIDGDNSSTINNVALGADGEDNAGVLDILEGGVDGDGDGGCADIDERLDPSALKMTWALPLSHTQLCAQWILERLEFHPPSPLPPPNIERVLIHNSLRIYFDARAINIMSQPQQLLNDTCINGIANLLHFRFSQPDLPESVHSSRCAIFSSYDLPMIRFNTSESHVWRRTFKTEYWTKDFWILPIHRQQPALHWVLCCIQPSRGEILLFDSFADRDSWGKELVDILSFIKQLVVNANRHNHDLQVAANGSWTARSIQLSPCQSNGYDCGLWVLATIAALLSGAHSSGLVEADMPIFRFKLLSHILALPLYNP
ncbi:hypothetical protein H0H93_007262 [Arthromyces matolae]|nr:hypothetical protein H0H93_007262 [Arthromyces matolae]